MRAIVTVLLCQASRDCTVQRMLFSVLLKAVKEQVSCFVQDWGIVAVPQALGCVEPLWWHSEGSWDLGCGEDSGYRWQMRPKDLNDLVS